MARSRGKRPGREGPAGSRTASSTTRGSQGETRGRAASSRPWACSWRWPAASAARRGLAGRGDAALPVHLRAARPRVRRRAAHLLRGRVRERHRRLRLVPGQGSLRAPRQARRCERPHVVVPVADRPLRQGPDGQLARQPHRQLAEAAPHARAHALRPPVHAAPGCMHGLSSVFGPDIGTVGLDLLPGWAIEGPAVYDETVFSPGAGAATRCSRCTRRPRPRREASSASPRRATSRRFPPPGRVYVAGYDLVDWLQEAYGTDTLRKIMTAYLDFPFLGPWQRHRERHGQERGFHLPTCAPPSRRSTQMQRRCAEGC